MAESINLPTTCKSLADWQRCYADASPSLNTFRRTFTALLRWAFSQTNRIDGFKDAIGCLTWSENEGKDQIYISSGSSADPGDTEQVPGIIISCDKQGVALNRPWINSKGAESPDTSSHNRVYVGKVTMQFTCMHFDADVACIMADYVLLFITALEQVIKETFLWLLDYKPVNQTEPTLTQKVQTEGASKWYESVVSLELDYEYAVFLARESKRLKDFELVVDGAQEK